jgi:probable rRNA maturation factor
MCLREVTIDVRIDDAFLERVSSDLLTRSAAAVLTHQGVHGPAELTIVLTSDKGVRELNRAYRGFSAATDVLAFGSEQADGFVTPPGTPRYLGDVVISFPRAEAQAKSAHHPVETEVQLLVVHGVLHLLGHDHADPDLKAVMWAAQAEILQRVAGPHKNE